MKKHPSRDHHKMMLQDFQKRFWISTIITIPILILSPSIQKSLSFYIKFPGDLFVLFFLSSFVYFYGGWPFLKGIIKESRKKQPGMMTLIALAITVAYVYSGSVVILKITGKTFFWELATLIDIMLLGHWIEMKTMTSAGKALEKLAKLLPSKAHLILSDGSIEDVNLQSLKLNDKILLKPGEKIPADGKIIKGTSSINQAMLTGESKSVSKKVNDKVIGGSINGSGSLEIIIEKTGRSSYIAQVIKLVETASKSKSKAQTIANKAAFWLTLLAISVGTITLITWLLFGKEFVFALERMVTVMVITCPHALGLAIPLVISSITFLAAKNGLLIRNRTAFEKAHKIDTIIFDKTGTLTTGKFGVTNVVPLGEWNNDKILSYIASIEINSEHSIAQSIVAKAKEKNIEAPKAQNFKAFSGKGVVGIINSTEIFIGNEKILELTEISKQELQNALKKSQELQNQGKTVVIVATKNKIEGLVALSDIIRKTAKKACNKLKKMGYEIVMITGDNQQTAKYIAEQLGIKRFFAQVLPDQKSKKVKTLQQEGKVVAMVGDGINDAPALAQSDVGIAIGAGTDIAVETSDVILTQNNPLDVVNIIKLSKITNRKMLQNLVWATGYNIITIPLAAGIFYNWGVVLTPAIGALIMSLSTVIVAINSKLIKF